MMDIPGYQTPIKIYESDNSLIYKAFSDRNGSADLLKILKKDDLVTVEPTRLKE